MGFHYGYEKRKFDAEWTRLEQEYRAAGMDDRQIAAMKEYDWTWFCSQRTYQNRVQALPSEQCEDESEQSCSENLNPCPALGTPAMWIPGGLAGCPPWRMNCCTGGSANCRRTIWNC